MPELREIRVQLLLIGCMACLCRLGLWAFAYWEMQRWVIDVGLRLQNCWWSLS